IGLVRRRVHDRDLVTILTEAAGRVEAAAADAVRVGRVDLGLVAFGEPWAKLGAEVLTAVALVVDHRLDAVNEVLVVAALGEQMAGRAAADQNAVLHPPQREFLVILALAIVGDDLAVLLLLDDFLDGSLVGFGMQLPACQILAVE